ncbi:hypothetical protein D922_01495 [Enterococcus faecalis 06-MB-DW-09]|nr:hypothetical protein D922_01495 [Enterococcus faecalis 06-MB-DW-09]
MNYKDANGIRVTDYNNDVRNYTTINDCAAKEQLCRATVTKHIKNKSKAKDGRIFTIFKIFSYLFVIIYLDLRN